jgi:hypothetical protein
MPVERLGFVLGGTGVEDDRGYYGYGYGPGSYGAVPERGRGTAV